MESLKDILVGLDDADLEEVACKVYVNFRSSEKKEDVAFEIAKTILENISLLTKIIQRVHLNICTKFALKIKLNLILISMHYSVMESV